MDINNFVVTVYFSKVKEPVKSLYNIEDLFTVCKKHSDNNTVAMYNMGYLYEHEEKSFEDAFLWYKKSADLGDSYAMIRLGQLYLGNKFLQQNAEKAFEWFSTSNKLRNIDSFYELGLLYYDGTGCNSNLDKSFELFSEGANMGNIDCMFMLGYQLYYQHKFEEAAAQFCKCIDFGEYNICKIMTIMYNNIRNDCIINVLMKYYDLVKEAKAEINKIFGLNTDVFVQTWKAAHK